MALELTLFIFIVLAILALIALVIFLTVFWIIMLVDCAKRDFKKDSNDKVVWILILIFLGFIGAIIYYFVIKKKK